MQYKMSNVSCIWSLLLTLPLLTENFNIHQKSPFLCEFICVTLNCLLSPSVQRWVDNKYIFRAEFPHSIDFFRLLAFSGSPLSDIAKEHPCDPCYFSHFLCLVTLNFLVIFDAPHYNYQSFVKTVRNQRMSLNNNYDSN